MLSLHELAGKNWRLQERKRLMMDEITTGIDELGVLLMGQPSGVYWYGSRLSIDEARRLAPHNNATSLQVTAAVLAGMVWAIENPRRGIVEPDEMDFERVLEIARALSRRGRRRLWRLDAAARPRAAVPRGSRPRRSLAVQECSRRLTAAERGRCAWLALLSIYALAAGLDVAHHVADDLDSGDQAIEFSELAVAYSAGLFWPADMVAAALLTMR